ncbi:hypothetical protein ACVWY2_008705 [Bradyrhizobium sp. JR6.1]
MTNAALLHRNDAGAFQAPSIGAKAGDDCPSHPSDKKGQDDGGKTSAPESGVVHLGGSWLIMFAGLSSFAFASRKLGAAPAATVSFNAEIVE